PFSLDAPQQVESLVRDGVVVIHLFGDDMGVDLSGRHLVDAIRAVHTHLVSQALRDRARLIVSGGIAAADHVAKAIACGADAVQLVSELLVRGAGRLAELRAEVADWLERHDVAALTDLVGCLSLERCADPEAYERAQYLRVMLAWEAGSRRDTRAGR
ncbi:MAG TPA: glutamate synthase-related protein, partial [Thermoanaerobaculia bacterium]|nr:glutamate synthase-related protein [Thermoanaerobaculia bacterium]